MWSAGRPELAEVSKRNNSGVCRGLHPTAEGNKRSAELGAEDKRAATRRSDIVKAACAVKPPPHNAMGGFGDNANGYPSRATGLNNRSEL